MKTWTYYSNMEYADNQFLTIDRSGSSSGAHFGGGNCRYEFPCDAETLAGMLSALPHDPDPMHLELWLDNNAETWSAVNPEYRLEYADGSVFAFHQDRDNVRVTHAGHTYTIAGMNWDDRPNIYHAIEHVKHDPVLLEAWLRTSDINRAEVMNF